MFTVICVRVIVSVSRKLFFAMSLNVFKNWFWKIDSFLLIIPLLGHIMILHIAFYVKLWGCLSNILLLWQCAPPPPQDTDDAVRQWVQTRLDQSNFVICWERPSPPTGLPSRKEPKSALEYQTGFFCPTAFTGRNSWEITSPHRVLGACLFLLVLGCFCWWFNLCTFVRTPLCPAVPSWGCCPITLAVRVGRCSWHLSVLK